MLRHALLTIVVIAFAAPAPAQLSLTQVGNGFNQPLFVTSAPGDTDPNRLYVVEKGGTVRTFVANTTTPGTPVSTFLDLPTILGAGQVLTAGEQGLLGMAFSPGFANGNGFVYVDYVGNNGTTQGQTHIDRFTVSGGSVVPGSRANILAFDQNVAGQTNHKGGWLGFGPDNSLYIATGDGGSANDPMSNAQNRTVLLGKMLRIIPNTGAGGGYVIPADNPFVGNPSGFRQEIYAYGLRNPFRNSFDRATGNLYIGDVGQGAREEINFVPAGSTGGQNFGWRRYEGNILTPGISDTTPTAAQVTFPIYDYPHTNGNAAITGGYVYRGHDISDRGQSLDGTYIFGDFVSGRMYSFRFDGTTISDFLERTTEMNSLGVLGGNSLASFGEDNLGRVYAVDIGGQIYRITGVPVPEPATLLAWCSAAAGCWWWRKTARSQPGELGRRRRLHEPVDLDR
jgi:hypothetical protein